MKIYTKTGDDGSTRVIGGKKVSKGDPRVAAYGTLDEVNSLVGFAVSLLNNETEIKLELEQIQQFLFDCGNDLATPEGVRPYKTEQAHVKWLEDRIDFYADVPPKIQKFILPGGAMGAAALHMARTVTRRGEREIVALMNEGEPINKETLHFINRLSDYFFTIARVVNFREGKEDIFYENGEPVFR